MEKIENPGKYDKTVLYSSSEDRSFISRMDSTVDNMTPKDMLEKIAELDYSQSQLRDLNAEMRYWLDVADDEEAVLRTENAHLRKQVKALETMISEARHTEAEPCKSVLADDFNLKTSSERRIQSLERESTLTKEQNEKLTTELKTLQRERDEDKISLSKFRDELQTLEWGIEEAQFGLQRRDDVIDQKTLQLKHAEEMIEEYSSLIKDLRLTNQELRQQLEERQDEASFAFLNEAIGEAGALSTPLSFAEEIKLLASSGKVETSVLDLAHEEKDAEEQLDHQSLTEDHQTQRCVGVLQKAIHRVGVFLLLIFILVILAWVAIGSRTQHFDFLALLMLQPYCSVHYGPLPPI